MSYDGFTCVPTSALATLAKLRTLTLSSNLIDSLLITSFQRVAKLNYLDLAHNSDIVTIEIGTFDPLSVALETANISDCSLNSTGVESISVLAGLRKLDLSYNLITTLTVNLFANLRKLAVLNLEHNRLTFVKREVFAGLGFSMRELYLSANNITAIQPLSFSTMTNLIILYINDQNLSMSLTQLNLFHGLNQSLHTLSLQNVELNASHLIFVMKQFSNVQVLRLDQMLSE